MSNEFIEISKRFWKEHPNFAKEEKKSIRQKRYISKKRGAEGSHTLGEWEMLKKKHNYCCVDCGMQEPFSDQWYPWLTEDHIISISKGGSDYIKNIQPLCHRCNCLKKDK